MKTSAMKIFGLLAMLATTCACTGYCDPAITDVRLDAMTVDVLPSPGNTADLTFTGTERVSEKMYILHNYGLDWASLYRKVGSQWVYEQQLTWWSSGPWQPDGRCIEIRDISMTFPNVVLNVGENRFRVWIYGDLSDFSDVDYTSEEFVTVYP